MSPDGVVVLSRQDFLLLGTFSETFPASAQVFDSSSELRGVSRVAFRSKCFQFIKVDFLETVNLGKNKTD